MLCSAAALGGAEARPRVVTSFFPLHCWAVNIAGDSVLVENLLPSRAEPHDYAFTPGDARKLSDANLIVVNGFNLEAWLPKFLRGSPATKDRVLAISTGLDAPLVIGDVAHPNPHVWLDPQFAACGVSNIAAALQRLDPSHAATYANSEALVDATTTSSASLSCSTRESPRSASGLK